MHSHSNIEPPSLTPPLDPSLAVIAGHHPPSPPSATEPIAETASVSARLSPLDRVTVQDLIAGFVSSMNASVRESEARTATLVAEAVAKGRAEGEAKTAAMIKEAVAACRAEVEQQAVAACRAEVEQQHPAEGTVRDLRSSIAAAEQRMQTALATQCAKLNDGMREDVRQALARDVGRLDQDHSAMSAKVDFLVSLNNETQVKISALQSGLGEMRTEVEGLQSLLGSIQQKQGLIEDRQMTLLRDHGSLKADVDELKADRGSKKADLKSVKANQAACERKVQDVVVKVESMSKALGNVQKAQKRLDKQTGQLDARLNDIDTSLKANQERQEELGKAQRETCETLDALNQKQSDSETTIATLKTQLGDMKGSCSALGQQQATLKEEVLRLKLFRGAHAEQNPYSRKPVAVEDLLKNEARLESGFNKMIKGLDKRLIALEKAESPGTSSTLDARLAQLGAEIESARSGKEKLELAFRKEARKQQRDIEVLDNRLNTQNTMTKKMLIKIKALALALAQDMDLDDFSAGDYPDLLAECRRLARFSRDPLISIEATTHARWFATEIEALGQS